MRTVTYFCDCGKKIKVSKGKVPECLCGKVFGISGSHLDYINRNKTWSRTTKIEFNRTTLEKDIAERNKR